MNINIDNYELFVMDYLEENLDAVETQEMETFLLLHPDIAMEIDDLDDTKLSLEPDLKLDSSFLIALKKNEIIDVQNINEENYEEFFLSDLERDINDKDSENLKVFLKANPSLTSDYLQLQNIKLIPDENITFLNKEDLKKKERKIIVLWPMVASIAALILLSFWLLKPQDLNRNIFIINKIESKKMTALSVKQHEINLFDNRSLFASNFIDETEFHQKEVSRIASLPIKMKPLQRKLSIEDEQWKNEMILMQSFVFNRNQLSSQLDYTSNAEKKKTSAFRLVSSLIWKTTKGQIKNISEEIISEDLKIWQAGKLEALTNNYVSVKPRTAQ